MQTGPYEPYAERKPLVHCPRCTSRLIYTIDAAGYDAEVILELGFARSSFRFAVPADGATASTITVTLTDAFGNPRAGKSVTSASLEPIGRNPGYLY